MVVKDAFKDKNGYHYNVVLDDGSEKQFNYSSHTGIISIGSQPLFDSTGRAVLTPNGEPIELMCYVAESEEEYIARIEEEVVNTVASIFEPKEEPIKGTKFKNVR